MKLFSEIDLSASELQAIARGLCTVALVDGLDQREASFISDLFRDHAADPGSDDPAAAPGASPASLAPLEPHALAALLPTPAHRTLFLRAAHMLAWADGKVSFAERASIDAFASALGVMPDALASLEAEVKHDLLLKGPTDDVSANVSEMEQR